MALGRCRQSLRVEETGTVVLGQGRGAGLEQFNCLLLVAPRIWGLLGVAPVASLDLLGHVFFASASTGIGMSGLDVFEEGLHMEGSAEHAFSEYEVVLALGGGKDDLVVSCLDGLIWLG